MSNLSDQSHEEPYAPTPPAPESVSAAAFSPYLNSHPPTASPFTLPSTQNTPNHAARPSTRIRVLHAVTGGVRKSAKFIGKKALLVGTATHPGPHRHAAYSPTHNAHRPVSYDSLLLQGDETTCLLSEREDSLTRNPSMEALNRTPGPHSPSHHLLITTSSPTPASCHAHVGTTNGFLRMSSSSQIIVDNSHTTIHSRHALIILMLEKRLGQLVALAFMYLLGAYTASHPTTTTFVLPFVAKVAEIGAVAWGTCVLIRILSWWNAHANHALPHDLAREDEEAAENDWEEALSEEVPVTHENTSGAVEGRKAHPSSTSNNETFLVNAGSKNLNCDTSFQNNRRRGSSTSRLPNAPSESTEAKTQENNGHTKPIAFNSGTHIAGGGTGSNNGLPTLLKAIPATSSRRGSEEGMKRNETHITERMFESAAKEFTHLDAPHFVTTEKSQTRDPGKVGNDTISSTGIQNKVLDIVPASKEQPHPELEDLFLIDATNNRRITPNSIPVELDSDLFSGHMIVMIRTTDADGAGTPTGGSSNTVSDYFRNKQRRFEFQFQVRMKRIPENPIYMGCELADPIKLGIVQRAFVGATLNFVKKMNAGFHYSLSGQDGASEQALRDGQYESTHMAFLLEGSMDRFVVTKPGETIPKLGEAIHEDFESIKRRRKGGKLDFNLEDTYTMAVWSAYADILSWKSLNFPGIRPFSLTSVLGDQPFRVTLYSLKPSDNGNHYRCNMETFTELEFSHAKHTRVGKAATEWMALESRRSLVDAKEGLALIVAKNLGDDADDVETNNISLDGGDEEPEPDPVDEPEDDDLTETVEDLGEGMYLKSGDHIMLREANTLDTDGYVSSGGGFAVLQSQTASTVVIEKASLSQRCMEDSKGATSRHMRSRLIKSGDTVFVKLLANGDEEDPKNIRFLSIHRGWWLKWVSSMPNHNGYFKIYTHETEGEPEMGAVQPSLSIETQSSYVRLGGSFSLRHRRWSRYQVGISSENSAAFGGKVLGLYKSGSTYEAEGEPDNSDLDDDDEENNLGSDHAEPVPSKSKRQWMKQLLLCAENPNLHLLNTPGTTPQRKPSLSAHASKDAKQSSTPPKVTNIENYTLDAPAWVEMMHRTKRKPQRVYVIRVTSDSMVDNLGAKIPTDKEARHGLILGDAETSNRHDSPLRGDQTTTKSQSIPFCVFRLRTGMDLAPILRVGLGWRGTAALTSETKRDSVSKNEPSDRELFAHEAAGFNLQDLGSSPLYPPLMDENNDMKNKSFINPSELQMLTPGGDDEILDEGGYDTEDTSVGQGELKDSQPASGVFRSKSCSANGSNDDNSTPTRQSVFHIEGRGREDSSRTVEALALERSFSLENRILSNNLPLVRVKSAGVLEHRLADSSSESEDNLDVADLTDAGEYDEDDIVNDMRYSLGSDGSTPYKRKHWINKPATSIGKVAKTVKSGTTMTGKQVAKVGKGTVSVGKSIISKSMSVHLSKPPVREPKIRAKTNDKNSLRQSGKDHHLAIYKTIKSASRSLSGKEFIGTPTRIVAGKLSAPDQSCRTVSHVLSEMSSVALEETLNSNISILLNSHVAGTSDLDSWFLCGTSVELGVIPTKSEKDVLVCGCIVARCLWESYWREEWCGLYDSHIAFYAPSTKKSCFNLALMDIQAIRRLKVLETKSPLPGLPFLVIETAWRCHYLAFADDSCRENFYDELNATIFSFGAGEKSIQKDAWKAHLWQGFQSSVESPLSSGRGKWASVSSSSKSKQRNILNNRRMEFDGEPIAETSMNKFVEELLDRALSFSLESLEKSPKELISFLDASSRLRCMPLHKLNLFGEEAFCIFVNVYHCLLQHALLASPNGPPDKRSIGHFMRTSCYEIGGDVFSLSEIECFVIRGKMSKAVNPRPPYVEAPKGSRAHQSYALGFLDPRINFVLNTGDVTKPPFIYVLTPEKLEMQMVAASSFFLRKHLTIDFSRKIVTLPKVCEVYRNDFGSGDPDFCVMYCVKYLDETKQKTLVDMMNSDSGSPIIKYQHSCDQFHANLSLKCYTAL